MEDPSGTRNTSQGQMAEGELSKQCFEKQGYLQGVGVKASVNCHVMRASWQDFTETGPYVDSRPL